uniref:Uncharacterized protein n=1 Tax=Oryza barthii TaxID=65489 RepID=A0A0D3EJK3_9ORYZ
MQGEETHHQRFIASEWQQVVEFGAVRLHLHRLRHRRLATGAGGAEELPDGALELPRRRRPAGELAVDPLEQRRDVVGEVPHVPVQQLGDDHLLLARRAHRRLQERLCFDLPMKRFKIVRTAGEERLPLHRANTTLGSGYPSP